MDGRNKPGRTVTNPPNLAAQPVRFVTGKHGIISVEDARITSEQLYLVLLPETVKSPWYLTLSFTNI